MDLYEGELTIGPGGELNLQGLPFPAGQNVRVRIEAMSEEGQPPSRVLGLHAGSIWMSDDFDAPLPDAFWLGGGDVDEPSA